MTSGGISSDRELEAFSPPYKIYLAMPIKVVVTQLFSKYVAGEFSVKDAYGRTSPT